MGELVLQNVGKAYDGKVACTDINLTIAEGEFFTFLGPSGCGKTTILRLIAGFIRPQKGRIFLGPRDLTNVEPENRPVGMVFQNYALFPFMTVQENIEYGLKVQGAAVKEIREKGRHYINLVGLDGFETRNVSDLSGGEQQRVALARSLVIEPKVLLLDEPLSNLDARLRDRMHLEIKTLQKKVGITTVYVTHDQTEALTMSDRIAVFDRGRSIQIGTPEEIYTHPRNAFVARFIGETNLFEAAVAGTKAVVADAMTIELTEPAKPGRYVSIRPQDIRLSQKDPGRSNTFKATLQETQFNGVWIEYLVKVGPVLLRVIVLNTPGSDPWIRPGEQVFISLPPSSIRVLEH